MKKIFLFLIIISNLFALTQNDIYKLYQNKEYKQVCKEGRTLYYNYELDDTFLSIVGLSCVKADMLNSAMTISKKMNNSPMGRQNASYIATLYLTKRLLLQLVWDNIDISNLSLPKSNHHLSIVFENIAHNNFSKINNIYIVKADNKKYILSPQDENKIVIQIFKNNTLLSTHIYW